MNSKPSLKGKLVALPQRDKEPDGAPTSLVGRIDPREMGSRVVRAQPKDMDKKKKKALAAAAEAQQQDERREKGRRCAGLDSGFGITDIIESTAGVEGLTYRPRTTETREVYELMLASVHTALGDQAQDIVRSAADAVLESLKREVLKVLAAVEFFKEDHRLYGSGDEELGVDPDLERKEGEIDDEVGVAVAFDEEEQEEE
ncbi:hypothetical protein NP233_g11635 [Leucocoprinus birnbaumii]|uniref:Pre-mRNA-splicing helicase BRR2-like plug domain-containing protein n=1 Tax=Leucocoprinus birnbaumii TaxID=56174 RepID=A0AAD5YL49_9AGAR|nr:hypothetical protein NP233_g11635 [Leucocoprinus birnbaumii]